MSRFFRYKYTIILIAILIYAFVIRIQGLGFGLPYIYSDEPTFVVPANHILSTGDLNPHWFGHPGSLIMYVLVIWFAFISLGIIIYSFFSGKIHALHDIVPLFTGEMYRGNWRPIYYLGGRFLTVCFALLTIYLIYLIGRKLFNKRVGIVASFCLAISPLHISYSRLIRSDMIGILAVLLSQYFLFRCIELEGKKKWLIAVALFSGFSIASKYTYGVSVIPIIIYSLVADWRGKEGRQSRAVMAAGVTALGFFIFAPFVILDFKHAIVDILAETETSHLGADRLPGLQTHLWYIKNSLQSGIGGLFFELIAGLGFLLVLFKSSFKRILFLVFPVLYFIALGFAFIKFYWWMAPVLGFEAVLFGFGFSELYDGVVHRKKYFSAEFISVLFAGALLISSLPVVIQNQLDAEQLCRIDSRTIAKSWIESHLPRGSKIAYEDNGPPLETFPKRDFVLMNMGWGKIISKPLFYYTERSVDYIVITGGIKSRYYAEPQKYPKEIQRYEELKLQADLVKVFANQSKSDPTFEIYKLRH